MSRSQSSAPEGQPTHSPNVRITGIGKGTDLHDQAVAARRGELQRFIAGQQQQVALSGRRQHKVTKPIPGGHMTYQNSEGQEKITLHIDVEESGGGDQATSSSYWEYALIDMDFDSLVNVTGVGDQISQVFLAAKYEKPETSEQKAMTNATLMPVQGITAQFWFPAEKPLIVLGDEFAQIDVIATEGVSEIRETSLRVDLKAFPGQVVHVGVYGLSDQTGVPVPFRLKAVCVRGGNPWTALIKRPNFYTNLMDSYLFVVPDKYPERPRMAELGEGLIPIVEETIDAETASSPARMFGYGKAGEIIIDTRSGNMSWKPV